MSNSFIQKILGLLVLLGTFLAPVSLISGPHITLDLTTAYAQFGDPGDIADDIIPDGLFSEENREAVEENLKKGIAACAIATAISILISAAFQKVPVSNFSQEFKENFLDCVVYNVVNALIEDMLRSLTRWVQSGFEGNPVFVSNINQYTRDIADDVFSSYIEEKFGADVPFICSPFRAQIQLQLTQLYQQDRESWRRGCTLTDVAGNVEGFLGGNFASGGWNTWAETFLNPYNNPDGAYLESSAELALRISSAAGTAEKKYELGRGFLGKEVQNCYPDNSKQPTDGNGKDPSGGSASSGGKDPSGGNGKDPDGQQKMICDEPRIVTPGSFIEEQIQEKFGIPDERLAMADELNELINAVIMYLVQNILTESEEGLAGYDIDSQANIGYGDPDISGGGTGGGDTTQAGPPGPSMCFVSSGTFIPQRQGENVFGKASFPLPHNVTYDQLLFEIDVKNTGLRPLDEQPPSSNGTRPWVYNIFYLPRTPGANDVFGYVNVRGDEGPSNYANKVIMQQGVITPWPNKPSVTGNLVFPVGATYHFEYLYDGDAGVIELVVTDKNTGDVKGRLQMEPDVPLNVGTKQYSVDLGFPLHSGNVYDTPSYGWEYSNLKAQFLSEGDTPDACSNVTIQGSSGNSTGSGSGSSGGPGSGSGGVGSGNPLNPNETPCPPDNPACVGPTGGNPGGGFGGGSGGGGGTDTPPPSPPPPAPGECGEFGCHI